MGNTNIFISQIHISVDEFESTDPTLGGVLSRSHMDLSDPLHTMGLAMQLHTPLWLSLGGQKLFLRNRHPDGGSESIAPTLGGVLKRNQVDLGTSCRTTNATAMLTP